MDRRQFIIAGTAAGLALAAGAAPAQSRLRVAVIGHTGRGGYGHGLDTMWLQVPETEIVAVADADEKGLAAARRRLKVERGFTDYGKMLAETRPDIVAIAPRFIGHHHEMALAAIEAGACGIYMEKPFCRTPAEADAIVAACERRNVKLALAHRNRYHPTLAVVKRMIAAGAIGRLLELRARGKEDVRGGVLDLWVLGSHVLNMAHYLAGRPLACSAVMLQGDRPVTRGDLQEGDEGIGPVGGDRLHARFEMECGAPLYFDSIRNAGRTNTNYGMQLIGTDGTINLGVDAEPLAYLVAGGPFRPPAEPRRWVPIGSGGAGAPESLADLGAQVGGHLLGARDLIEAIRLNRAPLCDACEGRVTVEMIAGVFESHRLEGRRVTLPLEARGNPLARM